MNTSQNWEIDPSNIEVIFARALKHFIPDMNYKAFFAYSFKHISSLQV